jgi:hypothetical protein
LQTAIAVCLKPFYETVCKNQLVTTVAIEFILELMVDIVAANNPAITILTSRLVIPVK